MNAAAALSTNPSSVNAGAGLWGVWVVAALGRSFVASGAGDDDGRGSDVACGEAASEDGASEGSLGVGCASGEAVGVGLGAAGAGFAAGGWAVGGAGG